MSSSRARGKCTSGVTVILCRLEMVAFIQQQLVELDCEARAATLWGYPLHAMRETLALGKFLSF